MRNGRNKISRFIFIFLSIILLLFGIGYFGLKYLQYQLENKITGCEIESKNFHITIPFEYINNWIVINAKVIGCDEELPFIFDTGAQTVLMDSLLNIIGKDNYQSFSFKNKKDSVKHAFNNELISLHQLNIDKIKFKDIGAISAKNSKWDMLNCVSAYGIIGYNVIQTFYTQIDYQKKQLTLSDKLEKLSNYKDIVWVDYESSINQETPVIKATINDSIPVDLFFDTGHSGGIILESEELYEKLIKTDSTKYLKYTSKPSIKIRGESEDINNALVYKAANLNIGDIQTNALNINVRNSKQREFHGFIGNSFLQDYIVSLDYKKKRIGFIKQPISETHSNYTFGINYTVTENKIVVSVVYDNSQADKLGIVPGDELYSINGIRISEIKDLCAIYRKEFSFLSEHDSILNLEIIRDGKKIKHELNRYLRFD